MVEIRPIHKDDYDPLVALTLLAFEPIFDSFATIMEPPIFDGIYPDWRKTQQGEIDNAYNNPKVSSWVAVLDGTVVGLIIYELHHDHQWGEINFLVVHPDHQNDGVGTALNNFALEKMREAGMKRAEVGTGADPAHAPARHAYEKVGFKPFPHVHYYKVLDN